MQYIAFPLDVYQVAHGVSSVVVSQMELFFIMAALRSRCGHYIFVLWFLLSSSFFFFLA